LIILIYSAVGAGMQPHPLANLFGENLVIFGQNWANLIRFG